MSGKTIRATRETFKSAKKVKMALIEGSKLPIFVAFSKMDTQAVADFFTGEEGEVSLASFG